MTTSNADSDVFIYTGEGGARAPDDVVRLRVDPSVSSIPDFAFDGRKKLTKVELCEGLVEIGAWSFAHCCHSITKINMPISLRRICDAAFSHSLQTAIHLNDGIESIGTNAFADCIFTNFRVPPLITVIPDMLSGCKSTFSIELPYHLTEIENYALQDTYCLRNVAFPPNAVFGNEIFIGGHIIDTATDLYQLFGNSDARIISALQHRFDGLPIHRIVYYQSYHQGVLQDLIAAINMRSGQRRTLRSKLNPTGNQQDCLGMTPLHILACSSVHDLELYSVIIENYPTNLITEDRWGATPLLYAFRGAAPAEIIGFLLESYQSFYPRHVFNWTLMVETMGKCDTPMECIENLLQQVKQIQFPSQPIDWEYLLDQFALPSHYSFDGAPFQERMQFLFMCGMSERMEALPFNVWRDGIANMIQTANFQYMRTNLGILHRIQEKLSHYDDELHRLKEATTMLELTLWKMKMSENGHNIKNQTHCKKKMKADDSSIRSQNRVTCGADFVIGHVLPFLISD